MSSNTNIGNTPVNQGYVQLIHTGETGGIDGTLRTLYDGDGTASDLQIASNKVKISTQLYIGSDTLQEYIQDTVGAMLVTNASHTNLSAAYDDAGDGAIDLTASGDVTLSNSVTLSNKTLAAPTLTGTTQGASITLSGDLTVNGTTTTVNQTNLDVSDNIIGLNRGAGSNANDSGLIIERGSTGDNAAIIWDESADKFTLGTTTSTPSATGDLTISTGTLVANVEGNVSGNLTTDSVTISTIQTGSESFADNDTSLMTSAAIQDKITSYGYVTSSGISFDGSTANGVLTFKDSDEATVEANLTFDGTDLSVAAGGKISVDEVEGKSNNTNTLLLNDDQTAATNMVTLQSINHINIMTDGNNNGTGNFAVYNGSYDVDTADLAFRITSTGLARFENDIDIPATDRLYLDGRGNTYITESSGDTMKLVAGGQDMLVLEEDSTDYVRIPDNVRLSVGTGNDLQLSHNATNSYIQNYTGDLYFQNHTTDGDIHFLVDDGGGNDITALQIDASEVGKAIFSGAVTTGGQLNIEDTNAIIYRNSGQMELITYGGYNIDLNPAGDVRIDGASLMIPATEKLYLDGGGDTYILESATDIMDFYAGNQLFLRLDETNNVVHIPRDADTAVFKMGVGGDLQIYVETDDDAVIRNITSDKDMIFSVNDGGSQITALQIDASEVGQVKLPNDSQKLSIGAGADLQLWHDGSHTYSKNYTGDWYFQNTANDKDIVFQCDDGSGGLTAYLTLDGSITKTTFNQDVRIVDSKKIGFGNADDLEIYHDGTDDIINTKGTAFKLLDNGTERLRINSSGNIVINENGNSMDFRVEGDTDANLLFVDGSADRVGIGTGSPSKKLEVAGDVRIASGGDLILSDSAGGNDTFLYNDSQSLIGYINGAERFRVNSSGNVGIAEDNIDANLHITGSPCVIKQERAGVYAMRMGIPSNSANWVLAHTDNLQSSVAMSINGSRDIYIPESVGIGVAANGTAGRLDCSNDVVAYSTSDKRLKENIKPLDNALDKVMQISGVEFDWKKLTEKEKETIHGNKGHDVGVIAQEIEEVLPEVVTQRDNGYKAVKYEKIVPLLIEAIKEQQEEIELLKANYDDLKYNRR